jgi:hypothetical protein
MKGKKNSFLAIIFVPLMNIRNGKKLRSIFFTTKTDLQLEIVQWLSMRGWRAPTLPGIR